MSRQDDWEGRTAAGVEAATINRIQPTDIMLGRGPTCYNNPRPFMGIKLLKCSGGVEARPYFVIEDLPYFVIEDLEINLKTRRLDMSRFDMSLQDDWEGRTAAGVEATTINRIQPTDIMLGRGPTCYNNPGNRVFRKLLKEHAVRYDKHARRRDKAALVELVVSKLDAMGYRFLQRSATGAWIEAPPHVVEEKVGHGLRDARLSASKIDGDIKVLPKNFRPATAEPKHTDGDIRPNSTEHNPTDHDIMLGKGPVRYNCTGNRVFRNMVKEQVTNYNNKANRTEKPAFVMLLTSEIKAKGYRFRHRSEIGTLVDAPPDVVKRVVTRALRNARTTKDDNVDDVDVVPTNIRPATTEQNSEHLEIGGHAISEEDDDDPGGLCPEHPGTGAAHDALDTDAVGMPGNVGNSFTEDPFPLMEGDTVEELREMQDLLAFLGKEQF